MDVVPATILMVTQRVGGVASGGVAPSGRLLGFVFGISGVRDGVAIHWSDMMAVRPEARRRGLGRRLKLHQRDRLLAQGIERVYWSYDPLVARNARLNLVSLGASPVEYVPNMYGDTRSVLHRGLDTDRLVVEWRLRDPVVEAALAGDRGRLPDAARHGPIVTIDTTSTTGEPDAGPLPDAPWVRVELPPDIEQLKATTPAVAQRWQHTLRRALTTYLGERHARVAGIYTDESTGRWFYTVKNGDRSS